MAYNCSKITTGVIGIAMLPLLGSCVDHDYDLSKDIDLTVTIGGGQLSVPSSSTDVLTLSQILDLDENSSIKVVGKDIPAGIYSLVADGDYVLMQSGDPTTSNFKVPLVEIHDLKGNTSSVMLDPFTNPGKDRIHQPVTPIINAVDLSDDDVTKELVTLDYAETSTDIDFTIGYRSEDFSGTAYIDKGFEAAFDESWSMEIVDPETRKFIEVDPVKKNLLRFTADKAITKDGPAECKIRLKSIDFSKVPEGQGLIRPGVFSLDTDVTSQGTMSISGSDLDKGSTVHLEAYVKTNVSNGILHWITGIIDPKINVEESSFTINSIPEFLEKPGNNLDIENPQIYLTVDNGAPAAINVSARLIARSAGKPDVVVGIGEKYGTDPIIIRKSGKSYICISRKGSTYLIDSPVTNVIVDDLGALIASVPDEILFTDVDARAVQEPVTIDLNTTYSYESEYRTFIPLAFGADFKLFYDKTEADWDEDLEKYNFNEVNITFNAINTIPMTLTPRIKAIDRNGNVIDNITATIEGIAAAGSLDTPVSTPLKGVIKSTAANLRDLDGIRLEFDGVTSGEYVGMNLNANQALKFTDIRLTIVGGVTIDLND